MRTFATHLESALDGTRLPIDRPQTTHEGRPLVVRYDLDGVRAAVERDELAARRATLWRWRELLPVVESANVVSLGEGETPLLACPRLGRELGLTRLRVKDETGLPTGSFKARGMAVAVSRAKELGLTRLAAPTAGNAGGALAAYAARAGLEAFVVAPADAPAVNVGEAALYGARVLLVDGVITDCGALVAAGTEPMGWFDMSTLKEPYRLEGKKTMGLELALQLGWRLPDAILYPTGGGTGLVGMWKAFDELEALGWIAPGARPRLYAVQPEGCAPIVHAFDAGERFAAPVEDPVTSAPGLRVPRAVGDFMMLDAIRASGGAALAVPEDVIEPWMRRASAAEGISVGPETACAFAALERLVADGRVARDDEVVVFDTGGAQKTVDLLPRDFPVLARGETPDWDTLA